jgi:hypothetical protein
MTDDKCACEESLRLRERVLLLRNFMRTAAWSILREPGKPATAEARWLEQRLADDDRLAQAEETTVTVQPVKPGFCKPGQCPDCDSARERERPEPYKPKVGDRVRLVASPCKMDAGLVGRELALTATHPEGPNAGYWRAKPVDESCDVRIHRDAVWEPVAEKPEPPASEPSEPSEEEIEVQRLYSDALDANANLGQVRRHRAAQRALYEAGRASLHAELEAERTAHEVTKAGLAALLDAIGASEHSSINHPWSRAIQYLENERTAWSKQAHEADALRMRLRDELEAERTAHAATKAELDEVIRGLYSRLREVHAEARKARPMPSLETIAKTVGQHSHPFYWRDPEVLAVARAVWALFGAQEEQAPAEPDNTPPDPLPEVLPAGTRFNWGGLCAWFTSEAHRMTGQWNRAYSGGVQSQRGTKRRATVLSHQIDWAHWRSQQSKGSPFAENNLDAAWTGAVDGLSGAGADVPELIADGVANIEATRAPAQSSLEGMPKPWRDVLELLGKTAIDRDSQLAKLEQWQRHVEAHHQPAEHSRRIGELAKRLRKLEKGE